MDCFHSLTGFIGLGVFFCFVLACFFCFLFFCFFLSSLCCKRSWCLSSVYPHRNFTMTFSFFFLFCTYKIHISFCQRTSAFYSWSNILFILSDLYPFRYLVITLPCLKKKRAYWKKRIKQLWFLKCTVVCLYSLCKGIIMAAETRNCVNTAVYHSVGFKYYTQLAAW